MRNAPRVRLGFVSGCEKNKSNHTDDSTDTCANSPANTFVGRDLRVCLCYLVHRGAAFAYRSRFSLLFLSCRWFRKRKRNGRGEARPKRRGRPGDGRAAEFIFGIPASGIFLTKIVRGTSHRRIAKRTLRRRGRTTRSPAVIRCIRRDGSFLSR